MIHTTFRNLLVALALGLLTIAPQNVSAATFKKSSVLIENEAGKFDRRIYTEIARSPKPNAPVVVLLNGLIYEINRWEPVAQNLAKQDLTIIRMSFSAQPESLRLLQDGELPSFAVRGLELSALADEVKRVLKHHGITQKVTLVGLSYGASVATEFAKTNPKVVKDLILLSPLVVPLDNYNGSSAPLRAMLDGVRFWENAPCTFYGWLNPALCSSTDFWYDSFYNYFYENYLNVRVATTPDGVDPALYKKSVFQMVRATRDFDLKTEVAHLKNVHFVIAEKDEANLKVDQRKAWDLIPKRQKRSLAEFTGVHHALPDEAPKATAEWIKAIATGATDMQHGEEYVVEP